MIRKVICFLLAGAMLGAGLYLLYLELFVARIIMGRMLMASGGLIGIGGAWLVYDFIIPWWRGEQVV